MSLCRSVLHLSLYFWQSISIVLKLYQVKKHRYETLSLHGAGKHLAKGEASRVLRHLVIEDILFEEVKKSDLYGSLSSVVKVSRLLRSGNMRFT